MKKGAPSRLQRLLYPLDHNSDTYILGNELGQLGCDLVDWDTDREQEEMQFGKIVKGIWAAPKGPYSLVYMKPGSNQLWEKIRTKGIPHPKGPFVYGEDIIEEFKEEREQKMNEIQKWLKNPSTATIPSGIVSKRFYLYETQYERILAKRITLDMIREMMEREGTLSCFIGTMKKAFLDSKGQVMMIRPDVVQRVACKNDWWQKKAPRHFIDDNSLSYPLLYAQ